jgi:hypothetical protein
MMDTALLTTWVLLEQLTSPEYSPAFYLDIVGTADQPWIQSYSLLDIVETADLLWIQPYSLPGYFCNS